MFNSLFYPSIFADDDDPLHTPLLVAFSLALSVVWLYSLSKWKNLMSALVSTRCFTDTPSSRAGRVLPGREPHVTIQIATYNEGGVVAETIDRACSVDWPRDKLAVQILDDSTDDVSSRIVIEKVSLWNFRGIDVQRKTRPDRVGYKAGSLHYHFGSIKGEYVAQLDADHRIDENFLRRIMPFFFNKQGETQEKVGLVQAPWGYYNIHQNVLTEVDALNLDVHHVLEQTGRSYAHRCFGFNGTGGVWRRSAIKAAGGWSWETVTEDLALSYQAVMAGYELTYVRDLPQLLEIPASFQAQIQQKTRWTKGFFQVFRLSYWKILTSPNLSLGIKVEAFCHVTGQCQSSAALCVFFIFPFIVIHGFEPNCWLRFFSVAPLLMPLIGAVVGCLAKVPGHDGSYKSWLSRLARLRWVLPCFALRCGFSVFETKAIFEGLLSRDATFLTTPKEGSSKRFGTISANSVQNSWKDDVAALIGLGLGIHRAIFVATTECETFLSFSFDAAVSFSNVAMCMALFWVNGSFLLEKHKTFTGLLRSVSSHVSLSMTVLLLLVGYFLFHAHGLLEKISSDTA